jgi:hypothetical protein
MRANLKRLAWAVAMGIALGGFVLPADDAHAQKEQFTRSKPHVNAGKTKPKSLKASTTPRDAASGLPTGKRQHMPVVPR